ANPRSESDTSNLPGLDLIFESDSSQAVISGAGGVRVPFVSTEVANLEVRYRYRFLQRNLNIHDSILRHVPVAPVGRQPFFTGMSSIHDSDATIRSFVGVIDARLEDRFPQKSPNIRAL